MYVTLGSQNRPSHGQGLFLFSSYLVLSHIAGDTPVHTSKCCQIPENHHPFTHHLSSTAFIGMEPGERLIQALEAHLGLFGYGFQGLRYLDCGLVGEVAAETLGSHMSLVLQGLCLMAGGEPKQVLEGIFLTTSNTINLCVNHTSFHPPPCSFKFTKLSLIHQKYSILLWVPGSSARYISEL